MKTDLIGRIFGKYKVLDYAYTKDHKSYWKCVDRAGNIEDIAREDLINTYGRKFTENILVGSKVGKLSVLYENEGKWVLTFHCKCDCGKECDVSAWRLRNGFSKSCGYCDHTGEAYNGYEFVKKVDKYRFLCKCQYCGKQFVSDYYHVKAGKVAPCKCLEKKELDLTGIHFGKLVVIGKTKKKYNDDTIWRCKCECGNECNVREKNLLYGYAKSCGCDLVMLKRDNEVAEYISTLVDDEPQMINETMYYKNYNIAISFDKCEYIASFGNVGADRELDYCYNKAKYFRDKGIRFINVYDVNLNDKYYGKRLKHLLNSIFCDNIEIDIDDCEIRHIEKWRAVYFCYQYDIENWSKFSKILYGVFYKDELVSVVTFGIAKRDNLNRDRFRFVEYCTKEGCKIHGCIEKVFDVFEKEYKPKEILGYCNLDYYNNELFKKLGFEYNGYVYNQLTCFWELDGKELSTKYCKLAELKKHHKDICELYENPSTYDILSYLGARKIYRSGKERWIKRY